MPFHYPLNEESESRDWKETVTFMIMLITGGWSWMIFNNQATSLNFIFSYSLESVSPIGSVKYPQDPVPSRRCPLGMSPAIIISKWIESWSMLRLPQYRTSCHYRLIQFIPNISLWPEGGGDNRILDGDQLGDRSDNEEIYFHSILGLNIKAKASDGCKGPLMSLRLLNSIPSPSGDDEIIHLYYLGTCTVSILLVFWKRRQLPSCWITTKLGVCVIFLNVMITLPRPVKNRLQYGGASHWEWELTTTTTASVAVTSSSSSSTSTSRCKKKHNSEEHHQGLLYICLVDCLSVVSPAQVIDIYIDHRTGGESRAREYTTVLSISLELASDSVSFLVRSLTETQRFTDNLFGINSHSFGSVAAVADGFVLERVMWFWF